MNVMSAACHHHHVSVCSWVEADLPAPGIFTHLVTFHHQPRFLSTVFVSALAEEVSCEGSLK